jgi:hypothetical protein
VLFSDAEPGRVVVYSRTKKQLDCFELATGRHIMRATYDSREVSPSAMWDVSPAGDLAVLKEHSLRAVVQSLGSGGPPAFVSREVKTDRSPDGKRSLAVDQGWSSADGDVLLLLLDSGVRLARLRPPNWTVRFDSQIPRAPFARLAISPGRRYILRMEETPLVIDTETGGVVRLQHSAPQVNDSIAWRADGRYVFAYSRELSGPSRFALWDLESGRFKVREVPNRGIPVWVGQRLLIWTQVDVYGTLYDGVLLDPETLAIRRTLRLVGRPVPHSPDGHAWYLTVDPVLQTVLRARDVNAGVPSVAPGQAVPPPDSLEIAKEEPRQR